MNIWEFLCFQNSIAVNKIDQFLEGFFFEIYIILIESMMEEIKHVVTEIQEFECHAETF